MSDMLWPDMTIWFIVAYDIWNFEYTYLNLPTHSWYCGVALLLAPTFANALWNKGAWIQNRANTLAIWCMWAQVVPGFQLSSKFAAALPSVYGGATANGITAMDLYEKAIALYNAGAGKTAEAGEIISQMGITADPRAQGVVDARHRSQRNLHRRHHQALDRDGQEPILQRRIRRHKGLRRGNGKSRSCITHTNKPVTHITGFSVPKIQRSCVLDNVRAS